MLNHRRGHVILFSVGDLEALARATTDCPICGHPLNWRRDEKRHMGPDSPTLDRTENVAGPLAIGDLQVVCNSCNRTKGARGMAEFAAWCRQVLAGPRRMRRDESHVLRKRGWATATRGMHRRCGYDVRLAQSELVELAHESPICGLCAVPLDWQGGRGVQGPTSPTLDRVDNGDVLTLGRVQILCLRCNVSKGPRSAQELRDYCAAILAARNAATFSA